MADENEVTLVNELPPPVAEIVRSDAEIRTKKIASCAVSLGVAILKEMTGDSISKSANDEDINELMSTALLSELKL